MKQILVFLFFSIISQAVSGQSKNLETQINSYAKDHNFNGTLIVQVKGKEIFKRSFGIADRTFDVPISLNTRFKIASVTKLFTSALIMQLYDEGKIDLNKPIKTYLPNLTDDKSEKILVRHLLNHTYGIDNIESHGIEYLQNPYTMDELLAKYYNNDLKYAPGTHFEYNNGDYIMLGKIIESICKKPYEVVLWERILGPLQMNNTGLITGQSIIKNLASTYSIDKETKEFKNDIPFYMEHVFSGGAMYSTVDDLIKYANALYSSQIIKESSLKMLLTGSPDLDNYGFGLWIRKYSVNGKPYTVAERPGRIAGALALLSYLIEQDVIIISLSNTDATNHEDFHNEIRKSMGINVW